MVADFIVEIQSFDSIEKELMVLLKEGMRWTLNSDGASKKKGLGIGIVLESSSGVIIKENFRLEKQMTNNETKYEAL